MGGILGEPGQNQAMSGRQKSWLRQLLLIIAVAFAIRMIVVIFTYRALPDADKHYERFGWEMGWIARAIASGHGFSSPYYPWSGPTAIEPPLFPSLLAAVFHFFGIYSLTSAFIILSLDSFLSALTCIPAYLSAEYALGETAAKVAACVWALYPFAIYFSAARVWGYALTGLLFTTSFCIAQRIYRANSYWAWLGWGALAGVTALSNPSTLATLPFLLGLALYQARKTGRKWIGKGVLTLVAAMAVVTPWTVRNVRALGILCPIRDGFWLEVYDENGGDASLDPSFAHPSSNPNEMRKWQAMDEAAFLAEKRTLAIDYLRQHPDFFIQMTLRRVIYYWTGFWSFSAEELREQPYEPANVFQVSCITFLMILGIRSLWSQNRGACLPYLALVCVFPVTYYVTHPLMDYRQPIEPAIIVLATAGAFSLRRAEAVALLATSPTPAEEGD